MPKYFDSDELLKRLPDDLPYKASIKRVLIQAPEADVVPKSEVERLVDKWIGAEGLTNDEKTLRLIEVLKDEAHRYERYYFNHEYDKMIAEAKAEVAREIFEEIFEALQGEIDEEDKLGRNAWEIGDTAGYHIHQYAEEKLDTLQIALSLYKKKYSG